MPDKRISEHTRKRLWAKGGDCCAFTGCERPLLHPNDEGAEDTVLGVECHIIAKKDSPRVARSLSSLSPEERDQWAPLIADCHGLANLVLMCSDHAKVIDDPNQGYSVKAVVEMKLAHEEAVEKRHRVPLESLPATPPPSVVLLENIPEWQRLATKELIDNDPGALHWLESQIGRPAQEEKVLGLVERWPQDLDRGSDQLLNLLAREAEGQGLWPAAATAWEKLAARAEGPSQADRLARAAIDAGVGGEDERRESLLAAAEAIDPDSVRVRLERFSDDVEPTEQLEFLAELDTDDPKLGSLIAAQESLANLLLGEIAPAERALNKAQELDPDSFAVRIAQINLEVQRARVALVEDQPFLIAELRDARDRALELRETLIAMRRWEESVRLLMMAADVPGLMRDPAAARSLLEEARPEEIAARDGASVLGDAALRAGAPALALRFVEGHGGDEELRRIEASARLELGGRGREEALAVLERLALGSGSGAQTAAVSRLLACLPPVSAPWNEEVAATLGGTRFERHAQKLRIFSIARTDPLGALAESKRLPQESWAAEIRLRIAGEANQPEEMLVAAEEFLDFAPDGSGRLLAARAMAQAGELKRAGEVANAVAKDPNAPPRVRNDSFHVLMKTLADRDLWEKAELTWERWRDLSFAELRPSDGRISAWQARVLHNRRRQPAAERR